jgi:hypothetical protein
MERKRKRFPGLRSAPSGLRSLDEALLDAECAEEAAIEASPEVARRPDADPLALLGVAIASAEEAARAA